MLGLVSYDWPDDVDIGLRSAGELIALSQTS